MSIKMNRKRKVSPTGSASKKNKNRKDVDCEPDNSPFVDDINDLFGMGFISIEEVDYFDPKKHAEQEALKQQPQKQKISDQDQIPRDDSALKAGWTVSTVNPQSIKSSSKKTSKANTKGSKANTEASTKANTKANTEANTKANTNAITKPNTEANTKAKQSQTTKPKPKTVKIVSPIAPPEIGDDELMEWKRFNLELSLLQGLKSNGFMEPMPIQSAALDSLHLAGKRDILGSAPTGSGKTLAFALPLIDNILKCKPVGVTTGLIIVPTRELAVQIEKHMKAVSRFAPIRIATVVGGLSPEKQSRQLKECPDVIIATPGRLSELMEFDQDVRGMVSKVKFVILDEADRMVQVGHFKELDDILSRILKQDTTRQVLLFSATLIQSKDKESPFARLCKKLQLDKSAKTLAQLNFAGKPGQLQESFAACVSQEDKETVLFAFLKELKRENGLFGRVLLFANSIDTIRRIAHLMALLGIPNISLHAQMQQRQRLNNLDRFKSATECLLIASDVASRGIDIVGVDHVIHFHLPKSKETYVHRCGRTARANQSGTSLALVSPEERKLADACQLSAARPEIIQYIPNANDCRNYIIPILQLARNIEKTEHSDRSARSEINWAQKLADECELVLDEDNDPSYKKRQEQARQNPKDVAKDLERSKTKLKHLLDQFNQK